MSPERERRLRDLLAADDGADLESIDVENLAPVELAPEVETRMVNAALGEVAKRDLFFKLRRLARQMVRGWASKRPPAHGGTQGGIR